MHIFRLSVAVSCTIYNLNPTNPLRMLHKVGIRFLEHYSYLRMSEEKLYITTVGKTHFAQYVVTVCKNEFPIELGQMFIKHIEKCINSYNTATITKKTFYFLS